MNTKPWKILSIVVAALGLLMAIGVKTFLRPCVHADGTTAACAGAGQLIFWLGIGISLLGCAHVWAQGKLRIAVSCALLAGCMLMILAPGTLQPICGMAEMRCRLVTQPAARAAGILTSILAIIMLAGDIRGRGKK